MTEVFSGKSFRVTRAHAIEVAADFLERPEGEIRDACGEHQRPKNGCDRKIERVHQPGRQFVLKESGRDTDPDRAKRLSVELQRKAHVVDRMRAVDELQLLPETGADYLAKIGPLRYRFSYQLRVGVEQRFAVDIDHRRVVDERPVAHHRFQHAVQVYVSL